MTVFLRKFIRWYSATFCSYDDVTQWNMALLWIRFILIDTRCSYCHTVKSFDTQNSMCLQHKILDSNIIWLENCAYWKLSNNVMNVDRCYHIMQMKGFRGWSCCTGWDRKETLVLNWSIVWVWLCFDRYNIYSWYRWVCRKINIIITPRLTLSLIIN